MTTPTAADLELAHTLEAIIGAHLQTPSDPRVIEAILTALAEARADAERRAVKAEEANAALRGALDEFMIRLERMSTEAGERWEASRSRADSDRLHDINSIVGSAGTIHRYLSTSPAGTGSEMPATPEPSMAMERRRAWQRADQLAMQRDALAREVRTARRWLDGFPVTIEWRAIRAANEAAGIPVEGETT